MVYHTRFYLATSNKNEHSKEIQKLFDDWIDYKMKGGDHNESVG